MKKHAENLGELYIKTEVVGDATMLADMLQQMPEKTPGFLSFSSFSTDSHIQSQHSQEMNASLNMESLPEHEDEVTETLERGKEMRTATVFGGAAKWRREKFELSLSYPGMFSDANAEKIEHYTLHLRVHCGRNLLGGQEATSDQRNSGRLQDQSGDYQFHYHRFGRSASTNAYFTVIPVLGNGELEHLEKKQGQTVYGTRNPCWPDQEFVFGKIKDISTISYLSLHVYTRNLLGETKQHLSLLLSERERQQEVRLKRYQVHKLAPSGEIRDNGYEVLQYDQRVLAFRECHDGGRFFPARVQRYFPFPQDEYQVLFEGGIETIDDIRDIFSLDVKGKVKALRSDGNADVVLLEQQDASDVYARNVSPTLLTPVSSFSPSVEKTMAKRVNKRSAESTQWERMKHTLCGIKVDVLSASDLPKDVDRPGCLITMIGNPSVASSWSGKKFTIHSDGKMVAKKPMVSVDWEVGKSFEMPVSHGNARTDAENRHLFEIKPLRFGQIGDENAGDDRRSSTESQQDPIEEGSDILAHVSSILVEVVDQGKDSEPSRSHRSIGVAKIDLAALRDGEQGMDVKLIPDDKTPYYKFVGSVCLHVTCVDALKQNEEMQGALSKSSGQEKSTEVASDQVSVCGLVKWYQRRQAAQVHSSSLTMPTRTLSRIERREVLRASLTPTENAQIDAFHAVLGVILKRVVSILREIQLFEQFEVLQHDDMMKFRHVHTTNADPNSEWIGRMINEMKVGTRKDIVLHLEMELLDLAASSIPRVYPASDLEREEWVKLRTIRQKALQEAGGFFIQDRTNALLFSYPKCFTGEGMISWILRAPSVLWTDQWTKYCHDAKVTSSCLLRWQDPKLELDPDAIQPPRSREHALMWLSALSDAGYVENVTSSGAVTEANKAHYLVEDRTDRFYRLREVELWLTKQSREKSLFPLDLVQEIDCYQSPLSGSAVADASLAKEAEHKDVFSKKLTEHVDGFLGTPNRVSSLLFSSEITKSDLLKPVVEITKHLLDEDLLWDWKYCLFIPDHRSIYMYEAETCSSPFAIIDMNSGACHTAYSFAHGEGKGDWFEIANATVFIRDRATKQLAPMNEEQKAKMMKPKPNGSMVLEFKSTDAQLWVQSLSQSGIRMDMRIGQLVVLKRLNATVLHQKCIEYETEFYPNDLEGSFQRLLNRFFGHDLDSSHHEYEEKMRGLRAQIRNEMKKSGQLGDTVLAYYGKGKRLNPKPTNLRNFTTGALYSGRIVRIRTPYTDAKYHVSTLYDRNDTNEVPPEMEKLLLKYKVKDKVSWLKLPRTLRDVFLLYDVEYRHSHEIIIEEGMLREHFRTTEGDLDAVKVEERCTDSNVLFKPYDLEDCVTRMVINCNERKPLGCLKIPIKMVSPHRVTDVWYPLGPESEMVQKMQLGQLRIQLRLVQESQLVRSKRTPALLEELKDAAAKQHILQPFTSKPLQFIKDAVSAKSRRNVALPSGGGVVSSRERSFLKISLHEARKLVPGDIVQRNPFVKIMLVHENSEKEEYTRLKADVKSKTVNPKWQNQEFVLGKTETSALSDKKAVLLRVLDEELVTFREVPLGCVMLEFQRDQSGFIVGLVLISADAKGISTRRALNLDHQNKVEVDAMLLGDEKARQDKLAKAKGNDPEVDGRLGKLRFEIELIKNESFVDSNVLSSPSKMATKHLDTKFSVELKVKSVVPAGPAISKHPEAGIFDWRHYTCVFQPHGEGGQRVHYDPHSEDLTQGNKHCLSELLRHGRATSTVSGDADASTGLTGSSKFLGRTYDVSRVAYFDVVVTSEILGRVFQGRFGTTGILKNPDACASSQDEVIVLTDKDNKDLELRMTVDVSPVGMHRAERLKRVLAETFRLVGMPFDSKTMNHHVGSTSQLQMSNYAQFFLWEVFKANIFPGRNISQELLAQVHRMSRSSKLHWRFTPQLLSFIFEHVFCGGERDLLSFRDAAALDIVLNRWSQILSHVSETKKQLIGHLHGHETPQLVQTLFTNCDWTGFEFASLENASGESGRNLPKDKSTGEQDKQVEILFRPGDRVHVQIDVCKHSGVAVDVLVQTGEFVAGTIVREYGVDSFDIAVCTAANVDELPPLVKGTSVFVCQFAKAESADSGSCDHSHSMHPGCVGTLVEQDDVNHAKSAYQVEYFDGKEQVKEWRPRACLDPMLPRIAGSDLHRQLSRDDFVRVTAAADTPSSSLSKPEKSGLNAVHGASRPAKVTRNHGTARYDVEYLDGQVPLTDDRVNRERIQPLSERVLYDGEVTQTYLAPSSHAAASLVVNYDVLLSNGATVEGIAREQLRVKDETFATDRYLLGSVFVPQLAVDDAADKKEANSGVLDMATKLHDLWGNDQIVKVYMILPSPVATIQLRDSTTNKLLQSELLERSEAKPRFVDQCHGYVQGSHLSKVEEAKLSQLYAASVIQRQHDSHNSASKVAADPFAVDNCVCLLLAPQPRVEIHGALCLSSSTASAALFKTLLGLALKQQPAFAAVIQKAVRSTASLTVPLNRSERIVVIEKVEICFDKKPARDVVLTSMSSTCDGEIVVGDGKSTAKRDRVPLKRVSIRVHFQLAIPHDNRGNITEAVAVASHDAKLIIDRLKSCDSLVLTDSSSHNTIADTVAAGEEIWSLESAESSADPRASLERTLVVEVLNRRAEKGSQPSLSLELVPLDDVRISAKDVNGGVHEICLPAEKILVEARLRRQLSPFSEAKVLDGPVFLDADHPKQQQIRKHTRGGESMVDKQVEVPPHYQIEYVSTNEPGWVSQDDLKFDTMHVHVVQVSQIAKVASNDITAEVMLVSKDFECQMTCDQSLKTPLGVVLTPAGEICIDMLGKTYPEKSSMVLSRNAATGAWTQLSKIPTKVVFGHPGVDLQRVSGVKIKLLNKSTKSSKVLMGTAYIPMSDILQTPPWTEAEHERRSASSQADGKANTRIFSVEREEHGRKVVVGKITLQIDRTQRFSKDDRVEARRFGNEQDAWQIDPYELLVATLRHHEDKLTRGLLAAGPVVSGGGRMKLTEPVDQELQLQKIANVMMISQAMAKVYATKTSASENRMFSSSTTASGGLEIRHENKLRSPRAMDQLKQAFAQTKWIVEDTAAELGIRTVGRRVPWSSDLLHDDNDPRGDEFVVVRANVTTATLRLRRTILKLYQMYRYRLIPTLQRLYELDAMGDHINVAAGEQLLTFFEEEVEDLAEEDQVVYRRVYQRLRLMKIGQVLEDIMCTTLRIKVMAHDPHIGDDLVGTAQIPLLDLIDQEEHSNVYHLTKPSRGPNANAVMVKNFIGNLTNPGVGYGVGGSRIVDTESTVVKADVQKHGKVHLRIRLTYSESALLEQATHVYKFLKAKYIMQHESARRRINAAVVPAQRRRWMTVKGYLDELTAQSTSKLHWERTPLLLSLVWDIFASHKKAFSPTSKPDNAGDEGDQLQGLAGKVDKYRTAVVHVHNRWANIQPKLDELLVIQGAAQIHGQRTPQLLDEIEREVEGLDVVLSTAWQQVRQKWTVLSDALEELVAMKEKNKIHLGRAPHLLNVVSQRCSKGLNSRHADAVSNVQFRWMAITQPDGPLCELRLMEKKALHWRRTHELVLLLNEQCEGFAEVDAKALDTVEGRWKQVQEWLDDVLDMQREHKIDCEATPFMLKKMHLVEHKAKHISSVQKQTSKLLQSSPSKRGIAPAASKTSVNRTEDNHSPASPPASPSRSQPLLGVDAAEVDAGRLEGLAEWYAIEEAKYELERIPYHRITTDHDRNNWLPHSHDGKDTRLLITQEEMAFTAANVRAALEDRGVIPKLSSFVGNGFDGPSSRSDGAAASSSASALPKDLLDEISELEHAIENKHHDSERHQVLSNPERFAELYSVIEKLGKTDLLWKINHVVNSNKELEVPMHFLRLLDEMKMRQIPTNEIENLARTLLVVLQKEALLKLGIDVPSTANFTTVLSLMRRHQVKDISLPLGTPAIQTLLQERGMDRKGEAVYLRGMRIGTQSMVADETTMDTASKDSPTITSSGTAASTLNCGLGIIDTQIELLRKSMLFESLRKRNSLIKTFPGETKVLTEEDLSECTEVDMSGDYMTLIERFQQLLIHESYTKRLASYAALDRCMRALVRAPRDQIVTKEDIALALHGLGNNQYRLPLEAFTREELTEAASAGKIRTPTEQMLHQCPHGKNAKAMAYYAAMSHAAMVYQEVTSFSSRLDPIANRFQDSLPFEAKSSVDGVVIPKDRSRQNLKAYIVDWLLGSEDTAMRIQRQLSAYHQQRLVWASAAFTLCNRWFQRGFGWCDDVSKGVGVKVLLQRLLLFEAANKMHMVHTEALLREVDDKCVNLRARDKAAKASLEQRYLRNVEMLEKLVGHAERCINNRKLHSEETPALLHEIEQVCVVPNGLSARHMEAYHVVTSHWLPHRARLEELVKMHKEGTFSIHRTPELLSAMEFHTEGIAGADELDEASIYATAHASGDTLSDQQMIEKKIDEIRRGQRKAPSSLHLDLEDPNPSVDTLSASGSAAAMESEGGDWKSLSPSKRVVEPLSPREKQTSWKVVTNESGVASSPGKQSVLLETKMAPGSPRRKSSLGDDIKELLKSPSKWLLATPAPVERIRPELFFPQAVSHDSTFTPAGSNE